MAAAVDVATATLTAFAGGSTAVPPAVEAQVARLYAAVAVMGLADTAIDGGDAGRSCAQLNALLEPATAEVTPKVAMQALSAASVLDCGTTTHVWRPRAERVLEDALEGGSLTDVYHAVEGMPFLSIDVAAVDFAGMASAILDLMDGRTGLFRDSVRAAPSVEAAARAYAVLARTLYATDGSVASTLGKRLRAALNGASTLLATLAAEPERFVGVGVVRTVAALLVSSQELAHAAEQFEVASAAFDGGHVRAVAHLLLSHVTGATRDVEALLDVFRGLRSVSLASSARHIPLVVHLPRTAFVDSAEGVDELLRLSVTDVMSQPAPECDVVLESLRECRRSSSPILVSDVGMRRRSPPNSDYVVPLLTLAAEPKQYVVDVLVKPPSPRYSVVGVSPDASGDVRVSAVVKVSATIQLGSATVFVTNSAAAAAEQRGNRKPSAPSEEQRVVRAEYPSSAREVLSADGALRDWLHVTFSVTSATTRAPMRPQQAFVRLTHRESGAFDLFVAEPDDDGTHTMSLDVGDAKAMRRLKGVPGDYDVTLLVGGDIVDNTMEWRCATVHVVPPAGPSAAPQQHKDPPLYSVPLLHESDSATSALPELLGEAQREHAAAPGGVAALFAAACCAPLAWLLKKLASAGLLSPREALVRTGTLGAAARLAGLVCLLLAMVVRYWLPAGASLLTLLPWLVLVAAAVAWQGRALFAALSDAEGKWPGLGSSSAENPNQLGKPKRE